MAASAIRCSSGERVAQRPMAGDLERVHRPVSARGQHSVADHLVEDAAHHAALARKLALDRLDLLLLGDRRRHVHRQPAAFGEHEREREVVARGRPERQVGLLAHRVDRPVAGRHAGQPRLEIADRELGTPVDALLVGAALVDQPRLPARVADPGVAERRHQLAQGVGRPRRVRVAEREQLAARPLGACVLRRHLALALEVEDEVGAGGPGELDRAIGRAVGGDDHLQELARVVERERVADLRLDHLLLVVRGDDQRHRRQLRQRRGAPWPGACGRAAPAPAGSRRGCRRAARRQPRRRPRRSPSPDHPPTRRR